MDDLSEKMTVLRLQDEKTSLMKKELELEEKIQILSDNIEAIMEEKATLDKSNTEIEEQISIFNKKYYRLLFSCLIGKKDKLLTHLFSSGS